MNQDTNCCDAVDEWIQRALGNLARTLLAEAKAQSASPRDFFALAVDRDSASSHPWCAGIDFKWDSADDVGVTLWPASEGPRIMAELDLPSMPAQTGIAIGALCQGEGLTMFMDITPHEEAAA